MKLRAFDKKVFTADVWSYTDTPSGNDVIRTFSYSETINVNITTDNTTRLIISSDAPITKSYQIRNVKDRTNASQFGVCCTVEGDDFLIWTVIKHKKIIMHRLYAPCTSSDRLEAHIVGFAKNIM